MSRSDLIERLSQLAFDFAAEMHYHQQKAEEAEEKYNVVSDRVASLEAAEELEDHYSGGGGLD
ncbi:hypothetical protein [Ralstonia syzygii]|uniref:hypothetical protein n=1 Tax=Ralstonia syzygii TaxID=28097 RepID=UPI001BA6DF7C|nr:hypothetical protein [Ralstonia syzygii]